MPDFIGGGGMAGIAPFLQMMFGGGAQGGAGGGIASLLPFLQMLSGGGSSGGQTSMSPHPGGGGLSQAIGGTGLGMPPQLGSGSGSGQMWAGGSPTFNEMQPNQPGSWMNAIGGNATPFSHLFGGNRMFAGGSPSFNERIGAPFGGSMPSWGGGGGGGEQPASQPFEVR